MKNKEILTIIQKPNLYPKNQIQLKTIQTIQNQFQTHFLSHKQLQSGQITQPQPTLIRRMSDISLIQRTNLALKRQDNNHRIFPKEKKEIEVKVLQKNSNTFSQNLKIKNFGPIEIFCHKNMNLQERPLHYVDGFQKTNENKKSMRNSEKSKIVKFAQSSENKNNESMNDRYFDEVRQVLTSSKRLETTKIIKIIQEKQKMKELYDNPNNNNNQCSWKQTFKFIQNKTKMQLNSNQNQNDIANQNLNQNQSKSSSTKAQKNSKKLLFFALCIAACIILVSLFII